MYGSKVALLGSIIDYAGTFPPAALALPDAMQRAALFRRHGKHPWLMAKVALPLADIKKITTKWLMESGADGAAWLFTALGSRPDGDEPVDFQRTVEWDLREARHWNERGWDAPIRQGIIGYEIKLPTMLTDSGGVTTFSRLIAPVLEKFTASGGGIMPFFEVGWEGDWKSRMDIVTESFASWCDEHRDTPVIPGIKVRTGGHFVPTATQLAEVIFLTTSRGLKFKATQGLHHPVTHGADLGFVNLFAALAFASALGVDDFDRGAMTKCLGASRATDFNFLPDALEWGQRRIGIEAIEAARRRHGATFGSCSLAEPDEYLADTFK